MKTPLRLTLSAACGLAIFNLSAAHFGLADATKADLVRIEWPSGMHLPASTVPSCPNHAIAW